MYIQLRRGVDDKNYKLIPANEPVSKHVKLGVPFQDYYTSVYKYNEDQYQKFQQTGTIAGVTDVVTDLLVFDFDSEDTEVAKKDAIEICKRLIEKGIDQKDLRIAFSGSKGFHVEVKHNKLFTPTEHKAIAKQLADGLPTFDTKVYDHARPFRVVGSVNKKTNLYKIPLTHKSLNTLSIEQIKKRAESISNVDASEFEFDTVDLPEGITVLKEYKKEYKPKVKQLDTKGIDWSLKPKWLTNCKYSLQSGNFSSGERSNSLICLAATYKNQGFEKEHTYRILKGVAEKQSLRTGQERFSDTEIFTNIIGEVYSDGWKGGQFTCREVGNWLHDYCQGLGDKKCSHKEDADCFIEIDEFASKFTDFATNINKNKLRLGVPSIDDKVMVSTSMLVGLLGAPSAGKTSLMLNFLDQSNQDGIDSVFFSMDMGLPLVYLRLIQKHFGLQKDDVFNLFMHNPEKVKDITDKIKERYALTKFSFKTGMTVEGMRNAVIDHQDRTGRRVKLIGVDYLECVSGPYSDPTANSGLIANQLKDMANDLDVCVMLLLQTQKQSGDPSDPLLSMRNVKGSSVIEQACSVIFSMSRPGFSPTNPEDDVFATISTVKDRMGSLMSVDCKWHGLTGSFGILPDEDRAKLADVRERKKTEKDKNNTPGWIS